MTKTKGSKLGDHALRQRAEAQLAAREPVVASALPDIEAARPLHELQVHQIELELQNEELRRLEEEAESSLAKYIDLYDFAPVCYLTLAKDGSIQSVNLLGAALLGGDRSKLIGRPFGFFVSDETRPALNVFLQQAFTGVNGATCEVLLTKNGDLPRFVRVAATVSTTGDDCRMVIVDITKLRVDQTALKVTCEQLEVLVAERTADLAEANIRMQQDIAERKRAEQSLRESEERYRRLLSSITSYVYRVHVADGLVVGTEHGEGCQAATGYTPEEYTENELLWIVMIPDEDRPQVQEVMSRIMDSPDPLTVEHRIINKDGNLRWIRNTLVPHRTVAGALICYDGIITDITERRQHEEERNRLEQEALRGEKLRVLGNLAAGVAHEVRNPLNAIMITLELIAAQLADKPEGQTYLERIRRQIHRIENLMKDLLELRRPEDVQNRRSCSVVELCRMAVDAWKQSNKEPQYQLITDYPAESESVRVLVDPERMVQVLVNLLDNAVQHSVVGSDIRILTSASMHGHASIMVYDQGKGLCKESLQHAFDPFFTTRKGGSGLGLSIVKHIVETYRGHVVIRNNTPTPGCTVEISLPGIGNN